MSRKYTRCAVIAIHDCINWHWPLWDNVHILIFGVRRSQGMKTKSLIIFFLVFCGLRLQAQDTASYVDRVFADNTVYVGHITTDVKGDYLVIDVPDKATYTISYSTITRIQYNVENPLKPGAHAREAGSGSMRRDQDSMGLVAFNGYRATPRVTDKLVKKRNLGIVITVGGACLAGLGAVIYEVTPRQTYSNQTGLYTPSPGAVAGVLMMAVGVGLTVPGVIIWGTSVGKIRRAERSEF